MNINKNRSPIEGKLRLWPNFWAAVCKHHCGSGPTLTKCKAEASGWKLRCILCFWRGPGEEENEKLICSNLHFTTMKSRGGRGPGWEWRICSLKFQMWGRAARKTRFKVGDQPPHHTQTLVGHLGHPREQVCYKRVSYGSAFPRNRAESTAHKRSRAWWSSSGSTIL